MVLTYRVCMNPIILPLSILFLHTQTSGFDWLGIFPSLGCFAHDSEACFSYRSHIVLVFGGEDKSGVV